MLKIAVCDDDVIFGREIEKLISENCKYFNVEYKINLFTSDAFIITLGSDIYEFDIVYLGINKKSSNGIDTAEKIRELCKDIFIVFLTQYIDYALDGYRVEAIRCIMKDDIEIKEKIRESLEAIFRKGKRSKKFYKFDFKEGRRKIYPEQILFIESKLHILVFSVVIGAEYRIFTLSAKLNDIENALPSEDFVRVHQSFLVNLKYIKKVLNYNVIMSNGMTIPIARIRFSEVKQKFLLYE